MSYKDIPERVLDIIKDITGNQDINRKDLLLGENNLVDSITIATLICTLEEEFNISFEDDFDMDYLDSVELLIREVCNKCSDERLS